MTNGRKDADTPDRAAKPSGGDQTGNRERVDERKGSDRDKDRETMTDDERIDEAGRESFPASDPPAQP